VGCLSACALVAVRICDGFSSQDETLLLMKSDHQPLTLMDKVLVNLSQFLSFVLVLLGGSIWCQEPEKEGCIKWMILFYVGVLMPWGNKLISKPAFHHQVLMA
jgi:hypothetical protein